MTVLNGQLAISPAGGYVNPRVSADLSEVDPGWIGWPTFQADIGTAPTAALAGGRSVQHPQVINGVMGASYFDDYYRRIHIRPQSIALGNLVSAQQRTVAVWNAWPDQTQQLTAITGIGAEGITLSGQPAPPLDFAPLQERQWQIAITPQGPAIIDATEQWQFASGALALLGITGRRVIAWSLPPDWADGVTESLSWLTDVQRAIGGASVRAPVRGAPRREWEFGVLALDNERQVMEAMLYGWSAQVWALPVWTDATRLAATVPAGALSIAVATAGHDYAAGALAILWRGPTDYEVVEVDTVAAGSIALKRATLADWPAGTQLMPARLAQLTDWPALARANDRHARTQLRFAAAEECDWPAVAPATTYQGFPVLARTNEPQDMGANYARIVTRIDSDVGAVAIDDPSGRAFPTQDYHWLTQGRADRAALRSLLYWLQGRAQALWVPSWADDLTLATTASGSLLTVQWAGVALFGGQRPGRRHLRIEQLDGTVLYRAVTASTDMGDGTERLSLDALLPAAIVPASVRQISWMMLATLAGDRVEINHLHDSDGLAKVAVTFQAEPGDEP